MPLGLSQKYEVHPPCGDWSHGFTTVVSGLPNWVVTINIIIIIPRVVTKYSMLL